MERLPEMTVHHKDMNSLASALSDREWEQMKCDTLNKRRKNPRCGYECKLCNNNEGIYKLDEKGNIYVEPCKCVKTRDSIRRLQQSGLEDTVKKCTLEKFVAKEKWQQDMLYLAKEFLKNPTGENWFFLGGQVGAGKTHICTGIVRELLLAGKEVRYLPYRRWIESLKSKMGTAEYDDFLNDYMFAEVLYIDDLYKNSDPPSAWEKKVVYSLINERYASPKLITILSCEYSPSYFVDIDEATGSRIWERTKKYGMYISSDKRKNYRTKDDIEHETKM